MAYARLNLPHLHPIGATFSILLVIHDTVPTTVLDQFNRERNFTLGETKAKKLPGWRRMLQRANLQLDEAFDKILAAHANQSQLLANPDFATILAERIKKYDGLYYDLYSYSILSNHAHLEIDLSLQLPDDWEETSAPAGYRNVDKIIQLIKGGSACLINKARGESGLPVWPTRYRDRFIRSEHHLTYAHRYTLNNPCAAGLLHHWQEHPFTGGMTWEEVQPRACRRFYPDVNLWMKRLRDFKEKRA